MEVAKEILLELYNEGYVETLYNTTSQEYARNGWTLKSGQWSPWYMNLRPIGANPNLVSKIAVAMNKMIREKVPDLTQIVGIEMAGVPLVSAISTAKDCEFIPYSYTRPLPGIKIRHPEEAKAAINKLCEIHGYGRKDLVEGRFEEGENLVILDDMVTNFGSKLITKYLLEHEMKTRGIKDVRTDYVAVVLDREQGGEAQAMDNEMYLYSLIKFKTDGLNWLREKMHPQEFQVISDYQENLKGISKHKESILKDAKKFREEK